MAAMGISPDCNGVFSGYGRSFKRYCPLKERYLPLTIFKISFAVSKLLHSITGPFRNNPQISSGKTMIALMFSPL